MLGHNIRELFCCFCLLLPVLPVFRTVATRPLGQLLATVGLGHAFRQVEEKIASSILGVRGRAGARWNHMNLRNTDPIVRKTVIMIVKS